MGNRRTPCYALRARLLIRHSNVVDANANKQRERERERERIKTEKIEKQAE